ncbi:HEAT repeat domain-containing protein, partial [Bacillus sp. LR--39]
KKPIQRNAILALAHFKDASALPELTELMHKDPRPVIRGTAAWAIGKIGDPAYAEELEKALEKEKDEEVKLEIEKGIDLLKASGMTKRGLS